MAHVDASVLKTPLARRTLERLKAHRDDGDRI